MLKSVLGSVALGLSLAGAAAAQDADWSYKATLYLWVPGIDSAVDTDFGTVAAELSPSDALANLDAAFMGTFAAQHGKLGLAADLLYTNLTVSEQTPGGLFDEARVNAKLSALSGYALYRVVDDPSLTFDLGGGFRAFDLEMTGTLTEGRLARRSATRSGSWVDPLVAMRVEAPINDRWFLMGYADFGGTSESDQTYQAYAGLGYEIDEHWSTQLGYRYLDISKDVDGKRAGRSKDLSLDLSGLVFAMSYAF